MMELSFSAETDYTLAISVTPIFAKTYPRVIQQIERQTD